MQIQKGQIRVLLRENDSFHSILGFTPLILRRLLHALEEGTATALVLHFQETLRALVLLLSQFVEKVAPPPPQLQSHIITVEIEAQRER